MKALTATALVALVVAAIAASAVYASNLTHQASTYGDWQHPVPQAPTNNYWHGPRGEGPEHHTGRHHRCWHYGHLSEAVVNVSGVVTGKNEQLLSITVGNETIYLRGWWVSSSGDIINPYDLLNKISVGDEVNASAIKCWNCGYLVAVRISVNGVEYTHPCLSSK